MTEARAISDGVDLKALIERVREATGADRALDLALATALAPDVLVLRRNADDTANEPHTYWEYTGKVDDALALVERMLPGWKWGVASVAVKTGEKSPKGYPRYGEGFRAHVTKISALRPMPSIGEHQTAPLAILLALLTSLSEDTTHAK